MLVQVADGGIRAVMRVRLSRKAGEVETAEAGTALPAVTSTAGTVVTLGSPHTGILP